MLRKLDQYEKRLAAFQTKIKRSNLASTAYGSKLAGLPGRNSYEASDLPLIVARYEHCVLYDLDGNEYVDLDMGFGADILGYRVPAVEAAVLAALSRGPAPGRLFAHHFDLAQLLSNNIPSAECVAFKHSGTDAVSLMVRLARVATGKTLVAKFDGSYHGWHDELLYNTSPTISGQRARTGDDLLSAQIAGAPELGQGNNWLIAPFGSQAGLEKILQRRADLAGVLVNPFPPFLWAREDLARNFVSAVCAACSENDIPILFDEINTGIKLGRGGAQEFFGVSADLVAFGKSAIGGNIPISLVTGRERFFNSIDDSSLSSGARAWTSSSFDGGVVEIAAAEAHLNHIFHRYDSISAARVSAYQQFEQSLAEQLSGIVSLSGHRKMGGALGLPAFLSAQGGFSFDRESVSLQRIFSNYLRMNGIFCRALPGINFSASHDASLIQRAVSSVGSAVEQMHDDGLL